MLAFDDVLRWEPLAIHQVLQAATDRADILEQLAQQLQAAQLPLYQLWLGESAHACQNNVSKACQIIDLNRQESQRIAAAVGRAEHDVSRCRADAEQIQNAAQASGWTITPDWKIDHGLTMVGSYLEQVLLAAQLQILQIELDTLQTEANQADHELATAMRAGFGSNWPIQFNNVSGRPPDLSPNQAINQVINQEMQARDRQLARGF